MPRHQKKNIICAIVLLLPFLFAHPAWAGSINRSIKAGNKFFAQGEYGKSVDKYTDALKKNPNSDIVNFNLGGALYKQKDYDASIHHLQKSLLTEDKPLKEKTYYNLGNSLYRQGMTKEKDDLKGAVSMLEKSVHQYDKALALDASDEDAKFNRDFVAKELERLKKKLQQQKQQQKKEQNRQGQQNQKKNQKSSSSSDKKKKENEQKQNSQEQGQKNKNQKNQSQKSEPKEQKQQNQPQPREGQNQEKDENQGKAQALNNSSSKEASQKENVPQASEQKSMEQKEAQMLLNQYRQTEQPKGLFNPLKAKRDFSHVEKDW